jgi:hypothetical protein
MSGPKPPSRTELVAIDLKQRAIELARSETESLVAETTYKVVKVLVGALDSDDERIRLDAAKTLLDRLMPKLASEKLSGGDEEVVETVDNQLLIDEIKEIARGRQAS